jgi:putative methyltransferase (TIGR04325 family)
MVNLPEWEYVGEQWKSDKRAEGWSHSSVVATMRQHFPAFAAVVNSVGPLGIFPLAPQLRNESGHNLSMTFGYVLTRAAIGKTGLSLLDWGGALGHYALMAQRLLSEMPLDITVKDLPDMCRVGKELVPSVNFVSEDDTCFSRGYDLVMASSSLQYAEHWRSIATRLVNSARGWIFVTRLPVVRRAATFCVVQRPFAYGYRSEYISWVFNREEFLSCMTSAGARLEREFIAGGNTQYAGGPEISETAGFLFRAPA